MSIKPIDFQVMMPKTAEVSKIQSDEQHKNQTIAQQQAATNQNKVENDLRQVHTQENVQNAKIREREEKNQENKKENKKKNKEEEKKDPKNKKTTTIDIRL